MEGLILSLWRRSRVHRDEKKSGTSRQTCRSTRAEASHPLRQPAESGAPRPPAKEVRKNSLTPSRFLQICTFILMLICMKLSRVEIEDVRKRLRSALKKQRLTVTEIGRLAGVHPSQAGRICRGEFRTMSYNVVQVCRVLGLDPSLAKAATESDAAWAQLERNLRKLWDLSPDRAKQMARLLEAMARLALK